MHFAALPWIWMARRKMQITDLCREAAFLSNRAAKPFKSA
jgi:hypothetical protein